MKKVNMAAILVVTCIFSSLITPIVNAQDKITLSVNVAEIESNKNVIDLTGIKAQIEIEEIIVENNTLLFNTNIDNNQEEQPVVETVEIISDAGTVVIEEEIIENTTTSNIIIGDVDNNGVLDANDASLILDAFKYNTQDTLDLKVADMDNNGIIDANDASLILELYKTK